MAVVVVVVVRRCGGGGVVVVVVVVAQNAAGYANRCGRCGRCGRPAKNEHFVLPHLTREVWQGRPRGVAEGQNGTSAHCMAV
jgi:hypothetical protein